MTIPRWRPLTALPLLAALFACSGLPSPSPPPAVEVGGGPRLALLIVVDQLAADTLERARPALRHGLARLLAEGAVFDALHAHGRPETAPGHATLATGRHPAQHGIVENAWWDRAHARRARAVIGSDGEVSPVHLLTDAIGDWLQRAQPAAVVVTASAKDRAAVLLGGQRPDAAFWLDEKSGRFRTSRYYLQATPAWLTAWEREHGLARRFGEAWEPLPLPDGLDAAALGFAPVAGDPFTRPLPRSVGRLDPALGEGFLTAAYRTPWPDEQVALLAYELLDRYALGADGVPDLLALSFSTLDFIGHEYGPHSPESLDVVLRIDRLVGDLLAELDRRFGPDGYVLAFSADHGVTPLPERVGSPFRRVGSEQVRCLQGVERELAARHGQRGWFIDGFTLDPALLAKAGLEAEAVAAEAATLIAACPGVARVLTAAELARGPGEDDPVALAISRSFRPERSPDLFVHWEEGLLPLLGRGTTHATAWQYDRRVPLVVLGPGVVPGRRAEPAATVDLAPTLAALLGVPVPADVAGRPLPVGEPPNGG
ncbi:MAG TPA: alkaline phosphatase family protein [Thermoanaerobaculia bacterium]|nr:alkaline phosphatase family protein [Thermoanaerobaculia bacterium]MDI9630369.1 alkaline phosphatase family protein [Acidobacteriota bacterium]MBP7812587.1 alkaline phosphatase family protein [Thermoanaerobaculia bacterium]MBP8844705.1 alkaline phosphatase family protein [Thermoanaerobaculia bacterium]HPA95076.1 alkaline phosphatase family protein [Thermoanaerobaculia bacterium]